MANKSTTAQQVNAIAQEAGLPISVHDTAAYATPQAQADETGKTVYTLQDFGAALLSRMNWVNEFVQVYNRIAYEVISSKVWENPLAFLFKTQNFGYGIEELFINIAKPLAYDPFGKGESVWERVMPDVRNYMHIVNIKFYVEQTIYDEGLRTAFTSEQSWTMFRDKLVANITSSMSLALYKAAKYMLALYAVETGVIRIPIADYKAKPNEATKALIVASNEMTFAKEDYNPAGVVNFAPKDRQYLFVTPDFDAEQTVDVYAYMFNVPVDQVPSRKIMIDNLWEHDYDTLNGMFEGGVPHVFTDDESEALTNIPAMLVADDLLFFYKLFDRWTAPFNDKMLYWNYRHHWQGTLSYSPFACGAALYTGDETQPTALFNPYASQNITVGRDNLFKVLPSFTIGSFAKRVKVDGVVTGTGLVAKEGYPGWYQAVNTKGATAAITYTYTPETAVQADGGDDETTASLTLTINVKVI